MTAPARAVDRYESSELVVPSPAAVVDVVVVGGQPRSSSANFPATPDTMPVASKGSGARSRKSGTRDSPVSPAIEGPKNGRSVRSKRSDGGSSAVSVRERKRGGEGGGGGDGGCWAVLSAAAVVVGVAGVGE